MKQFIKNMEYAKVAVFKDFVDYLPGQIASKTLAQNQFVSLTVFAFDQGEEISTHESSGDALVMALDGKGRVIIDGKEYLLQKGESILMPANYPHAVFAVEQFKMFLVVVFPRGEEKRDESQS